MSQDVLRVWERRYAAVEPARSAGNQRLYSDEDIARFRLLAAATSRGRNIGSVASLPTAVLARMVEEDDASAAEASSAKEPVSDTALLDEAIALTQSLDGNALDRRLRYSIVKTGLPAFLEVDAPAFMRRVGDDWEAGRLSVAQEHLASAVVLTITLDAVRELTAAPGAPLLLVTTLSRERHGVGAALAAAVAALEGWAVVHLGADVPSPDIAASAAACGARAIAISIVHDDDRAHVLREIANLGRAATPATPVIVGGATAAGMSASLGAAGAVVCRTFDEFRSALGRASRLPVREASR